MGSLQDALLESGLIQADRLKQARKKTPVRDSSRTGVAHAGKKKKTKNTRNKRTQSELAHAYAARRKAEQVEKERQKQARVADQEARRKRNLALDELVEGRALNSDAGDQPRYFEHIGRIRRVLCTPEQRTQINQGELGVVSLRGHYLLVDPDTLEKYRALAPDLVPDLSGAEPEAEDDYPPVPDDITW